MSSVHEHEYLEYLAGGGRPYYQPYLDERPVAETGVCERVSQFAFSGLRSLFNGGVSLVSQVNRRVIQPLAESRIGRFVFSIESDRFSLDLDPNAVNRPGVIDPTQLEEELFHIFDVCERSRQLIDRIFQILGLPFEQGQELRLLRESLTRNRAELSNFLLNFNNVAPREMGRNQELFVALSRLVNRIIQQIDGALNRVPIATAVRGIIVPERLLSSLQQREQEILRAFIFKLNQNREANSPEFVNRVSRLLNLAATNEPFRNRLLSLGEEVLHDCGDGAGRVLTQLEAWASVSEVHSENIEACIKTLIGVRRASRLQLFVLKKASEGSVSRGETNETLLCLSIDLRQILGLPHRVGDMLYRGLARVTPELKREALEFALQQTNSAEGQIRILMGEIPEDEAEIAQDEIRQELDSIKKVWEEIIKQKYPDEFDRLREPYNRESDQLLETQQRLERELNTLIQERSPDSIIHPKRHELLEVEASMGQLPPRLAREERDLVLRLTERLFAEHPEYISIPTEDERQAFSEQSRLGEEQRAFPERRVEEPLPLAGPLYSSLPERINQKLQKACDLWEKVYLEKPLCQTFFVGISPSLASLIFSVAYLATTVLCAIGTVIASFFVPGGRGIRRDARTACLVALAMIAISIGGIVASCIPGAHLAWKKAFNRY